MDTKLIHNLKSNDAAFQQLNIDTSAQQQKNASVRDSVRSPLLDGNHATESSKILKEVLQISDTINRKVKFSVDTESNRVIVRVIDNETKEVIKELPPEAMVKLHKKMQEAMGILGILVDQKA